MFLFSDDPLFTDEELFLMCAASGGKTVQDTATGNPLTFVTDLARPLKSLLIPFTPVQSGTGDPSPENIRPILPWNGLTVWNSGVNVWDEQWEVGSINENSGLNEPGSDRIRSKGYIPVRPSTRYYKTAANNIRVVYYDADKQYISYRGYETNTAFQTPQNCYFIRFNTNGAYGNVYKNDIAINYPSTKTEYEKSHITETDISFASPVYGGTLDVVSGVLTVEWALFTAKWKDGEYPEVFDSVTRKRFALSQVFVPAGGTQTAFCDIAKWYWHFEADEVHFYADQGRAFVFLPNDTDGETEIHIVGKLATPQEITLTPEQITALVGNNTILSDADGQMTAVYLKKG